MTRHDERLDGNDAGPTEYPLNKLSNLTFHRSLTTCETHHSNDVSGSNKKIWKIIKALSSCSIKLRFFKTNMDKIITIILAV